MSIVFERGVNHSKKSRTPFLKNSKKQEKIVKKSQSQKIT